MVKSLNNGRTEKLCRQRKERENVNLSRVDRGRVILAQGWGLIDINSNYDLLATSAGFFIFTYIGLLVAFKFKVTCRSMLVSISQSSIFVAGEVLFVMMFFFREFSRVSDFVFSINTSAYHSIRHICDIPYDKYL